MILVYVALAFLAGSLVWALVRAGADADVRSARMFAERSEALDAARKDRPHG